MKINTLIPSSSDLNYFEEIALTGSLSRAAERLAVGQPALSLALKRVETSVGARVFFRRSRGLELTPAGHKLLQQTQRLKEEWRKVLLEVQNLHDEVKGLFRIGCHTAVATYTMNVFLRDMYKEFHGIQFQLTHGLSRVMSEQVISGSLDFAFVINPVMHPDLVIRKMASDEVCFWALPKSNKHVLIADPDLTQSQVLSRKTKGHFERLIHSSSLEVVAALAKSGTGTAILPTRVVRQLAPELRRVEGLPRFTDEVSFIYRRDLPQTAAARVVRDYVRKMVI